MIRKQNMLIAGAAVLLSLSVLIVYYFVVWADFHAAAKQTNTDAHIAEVSVVDNRVESVDVQEDPVEDVLKESVVVDDDIDELVPVREYDAPCDEEGLQAQLAQLLSSRDWIYSLDQAQEITIARMQKLDYVGRLPFGYTNVCTVTAMFTDEVFDGEPGELSYGLFSGGISDRKTEVTIGGKTFTPNPADGPMGTGNVLPFTADGESVQFLELSEGFFYTRSETTFEPECPCNATYRATLTAPMYPEDHPF